MGKNSKASSGAAAGGNLLYFEPEKLTIVTDKAHPLYDERAEKEPSEAFIRNVALRGIRTPVTLRHNGYADADKTRPIVEVVMGRKRVRACLIVNERRAAEGLEPLRVPAVMARGEASVLMGDMISENELREADTPLIRARKLARYLETGRTEEEAAVVFGVTEQTIKNLLKVLELHPTVQKWIEGGGPVNVAKELSVIPQEGQPAALDKLIASGNIKGARAVEAARNVRKNGEATATKARMMSKVVIGDWRKALKGVGGKEADIAHAILSRILGNERALSNFPHLKELLDKAQGIEK